MKLLHTSASFEMTARPPLLVRSEFFKGDDGSLVHYVDEVKRATVPPEGWDDYCNAWPDAKIAIGKIAADFRMQSAMADMIAISQAGLPVGGEVITPVTGGEGDTANTESPTA